MWHHQERSRISWGRIQHIRFLIDGEGGVVVCIHCVCCNIQKDDEEGDTFEQFCCEDAGSHDKTACWIDCVGLGAFEAPFAAPCSRPVLK